VPPSALTALQLRPYLERCGYTGPKLAEAYQFAENTVQLAGFIGKPWDARSACIAVADATIDSRLTAHSCIGLGAPTALICRGDTLDWWKLTISGPSDVRSVRASDVEGFFRQHSDALKPEAIYAAKMRQAAPSKAQMWFVDVGLMPALERRAGEALDRLVSQAIQTLLEELGGKVRTRDAVVGVYKTVFWLLAAKLLREKGVRDFTRLDLADVTAVFAAVGSHYRDAKDCPPGDRTWRPAITRVAETISKWGHLGNITTESLAYLYETALIGQPVKRRRGHPPEPREDVRKALGIHSTPSPLVDHMLAQLWPLIEPIDAPERRVFEPACGHAAFLTAALRWLRQWSGMEQGMACHRYLRERLRGVEMDPFAVEIAKLSLTLADVPFGNAWHIQQGDMFEPGALRRATEWATVVLSNPPYEAFGKTGAKRYARSSEPATALTKAVEMLKRTVPTLVPGAAFGFVLPQGTLYDKEAKSLRRRLLDSCEIAEISLFEDKLFNKSDHETCIVLGRRKGGRAPVRAVTYRRVRNRDMEAFRTSLAFSREDTLAPSELGRGPESSLYEPDLRDFWAHTTRFRQLSEAFDVQKGYEFYSPEELRHRGLLSRTERERWIPVAFRASDPYGVWELPIAGWLKFGPNTYRARGGGAEPGHMQVVLNYARVAREPWRLKAVVDRLGIAVSSRFLVFRPRTEQSSLIALWAVLNSPVANAFSYCWSSKRETLAKTWRSLPLPVPNASQLSGIEDAAARYLTLASPPKGFTLRTPDEAAIRRALLDLDAAVLRLYDLPTELEQELLAIFAGVDRPGVGCRFRGYPEGWSSRSATTRLAIAKDDRPIWERIASLAATLPNELIAELPADGALEHDHYLYGAPKTKP
jgi:hypothetical protein